MTTSAERLTLPTLPTLPAEVSNPLETARLASVDQLVRSLEEQLLGFPDVDYEVFRLLSNPAKKEILSKSRILGTDTYNRCMDELQSLRLIESPDFPSGTTVAMAPATFSLQLRRSPQDFLIACGVEEMVEKLTAIRINQAEIDFAEKHYQRTANPYFNKQMWQDIVDKHDGHLPITISGVRDGTVLIPGEPLLHVKGPSELIAHFETYFHRVCYQTLIASKARALLEILGDENRFIEVGLRGIHDGKIHLDALEAIYVGSGIRLTSNDAAPAMLPSRDAGTIGHRYVQAFPSQEQAFRHAIEHKANVTLLVDLVNSIDGIDLALKLKNECRESGKAIGVRLDSGNLEELKSQTRHYLRQTQKLGLTDSKKDYIVIEGIETLQDIAELEAMIIQEFGQEARARVLYGAGGLMVSEETARKHASSGYKLSEYTEIDGRKVSTQKFSDSPGKESYPGSPELALVNGRRTVVQTGESFEGSTVESFFELLYSPATLVVRSNIEEARSRASRQFAALCELLDGATGFKSLRASTSPETHQKRLEVRARYGLKDCNRQTRSTRPE